ncbi:MAG TPA: hypothetical protein VM260_05265, partial [Pirellula sp.]|nr:hypothetical protein [Pirellula sp.]
NVRLSANGENTLFHAAATIKASADSRIEWVKATHAGINWSRLYAIVGSKTNYFQSNKYLNRIDLVRKTTTGFPEGEVKRIEFGYDYTLCPGTPNSKVSNGAKLTLKSVQTYVPYDGDPESGVVSAPYTFEYQSDINGNPFFGDEYHKDIWGMYKKDGAINNHMVTQPPIGGTYPQSQAQPGVAWNLVKVKTPTGGSINVNYIRDHYFIGGVGQEPSASKLSFVVPDLYSNSLPLNTNGDIDISQLSEIKPTYFETVNSLAKELEPIELSALDMTPTEMAKGLHTIPGGSTCHLRKYPEGPSKPNFIKFASAPANLGKGEMLLVVYQLWYQNWNTWSRSGSPPNVKGPTHNLLTTGILNLVMVEDITSGGYKVKPLMTADENGNFYVYKNLMYDPFGTVQYEWNYYAYRLNSRQRVYGGDVAVSHIELNDGFGVSLTKMYEFDALDIRS